MSKSYEIVIDSLKEKIELIISRYEFLLSENMALAERLRQSESKLEVGNNRIKELEQRIDNLQLIGAFKASYGDVREAKQNIGKIVREIDRCISLLGD